MWGNHIIFWGHEGRICGYLYAFVSSLLNKNKQGSLKSKSPRLVLSKRDSLGLLASWHHLGDNVPWGVFCTWGCGVALCFSPEKKESGVPSPAALLIAWHPVSMAEFGPWVVFYWMCQVNIIQWVARPKRVSKAKYHCFRTVPILMLSDSSAFFLSRERVKNSRARASFPSSSPAGTGVRELERPFFACKPHHVLLPTGGGEITAWIY